MLYQSLPHHDALPLHCLVGTFAKNRTTNSYKFYWFLALLKMIEEGTLSPEKPVPLQAVFTKMIALSWHTVALYKLSLGTMDKLGDNIQAFQKMFPDTLTTDTAVVDIETKLLKEQSCQKKLTYLKANVPYRFLSTFFVEELKGAKAFNQKVIALCKEKFHTKKPPIYSFVGQRIEIHQEWFHYLKNNLKILQDFCYLNLINYLSRRNPNVPNISNKLFLPVEKRNLQPARNYWKKILKEQAFKCIYSKELLTPENLSIDHFIPWSFVAHDMLWNLTPTFKEVNSSKSDKLPDFQAYFQDFSTQQFESFNILCAAKQQKALEDYAIAFNTRIDTIKSYSKDLFAEKLSQQVEPLFQIARNLGFQGNWKY